MSSVHFKGKIFPVMAFVAGTCIGGGMLGLPVATSFSGFFPSLVMMAICCAFMAITGLLFVEATLWMGPGAHVITMSRRLLGRPGEVVAGLIYLFIAYASLVAYSAGGGELVQIAASATGAAWPPWLASLIFTALFGLVILLGNKIIGRVNSILVVALLVTYLALLGGGVASVKGSFLLRSDWMAGFSALPLLLTIFSYQAVVPSLVLYLDGDAFRLRKAIIGGMVLAFLIYALWQLLVLGVVPLQGEYGLAEAVEQGTSITNAFRFHAKARWISAMGEAFAFFAIVTSFLGIGLGLYDFLADALKIGRKGMNRLYLTLLVVVPSYLFAISFERIFILALDASGGFGDTILNGVIPALMVWSGRYVKGYKGQLIVRGGKFLLICVILFALFILGVEIWERFTHPAPIEDLR